MEKKQEEDATNKVLPFQLFMCCRSHITIRIGENPEKPADGTRALHAGDVFAAKYSHNNQFARFRVRRHNKRQWVSIADKENHTQLLTIFPPSMADFYHLGPGQDAMERANELALLFSAHLSSEHQVQLSTILSPPIERLILEYIPFSVPILTMTASIFRGHGRWTQFCVPFFHRKDHVLEYLRRCESVHKHVKAPAMTSKEEYENEKQEWLTYKQRFENNIDYMAHLYSNNPSANADDNNDDPHLTMVSDPNHDNDADNDETNESNHDLPPNDADTTDMGDTWTSEATDATAEADMKEDLEQLEVNEEEAYLKNMVNQKPGALPRWLKQIYSNLTSPNACYYSAEVSVITNDVGLKLEQGETLSQVYREDRSIILHSKTSKREYSETPQLIAVKYAEKFEDLFEKNTAQGSCWMEFVFRDEDDNTEIFGEHKSARLTVKVGGNWESGKSRHWITLMDENQKAYSQYLPMISINAVVSCKIKQPWLPK